MSKRQLLALKEEPYEPDVAHENRDVCPIDNVRLRNEINGILMPAYPHEIKVRGIIRLVKRACARAAYEARLKAGVKSAEYYIEEEK